MINDYASLQSAIANELARSDLTSAIPTFIQLAEADFNRTLRTRFQQATASGTITDDLTLPDDFLQMVSFRLVQNGIQREIYPDPPAGLERLVNSQGLPGGYVVINDPTGYLDGFEYVMTYISSIPALSDTQTQNWLVLREPGLYMYGALIHSAPYMREDERIETWAAMAKAIMDGIKREDDYARYGNSPSQLSPYVCAP